MDCDRSRLSEYLQQVELAAEDILSDRQHIVELDRRRQDTRMAARYVKTNKYQDNKQWVCMGNTFIKLPTNYTAGLLDRDYKNLEVEINQTRDGLKGKMERLRDLENKPAMKGFHLNPLSRSEYAALNSVTKNV